MSSARAENRDKGFGMRGVKFFSKSCDCNPAMDLGFVGIQRLLLITVKKLTRATLLNLSPNAVAVCGFEFEPESCLDDQTPFHTFEAHYRQSPLTSHAFARPPKRPFPLSGS